MKMMHQVYKTLPDDRPITGICVIEDLDKCPAGYVAVSRTLDQDSDADLWRENFIFGRRLNRYICLSKSEQIGDYIVEAIGILNEKEVPPDGYSIITRTRDSAQRAWRKRQLCYRLAKKSQAMSAVTDIIVLSKMKKAPEGFSLAGEINGMTLCFKTRSSTDFNSPTSPNTPLLYSINPNSPTGPDYQNILSHLKSTSITPGAVTSPPPRPPRGINTKSPTPSTRSQQSNGGNTRFYPLMTNDEYVELQPTRPAPMPPNSITTPYSPSEQNNQQKSSSSGNNSNYNTLAVYNGLEGVPFALNTLLMNSKDSAHFPAIKAKTKYQLDKEYDYDFRNEKEATVTT